MPPSGVVVLDFSRDIPGRPDGSTDDRVPFVPLWGEVPLLIAVLFNIIFVLPPRLYVASRMCGRDVRQLPVKKQWPPSLYNMCVTGESLLVCLFIGATSRYGVALCCTSLLYVIMVHAKFDAATEMLAIISLVCLADSTAMWVILSLLVLISSVVFVTRNLL